MMTWALDCLIKQSSSFIVFRCQLSEIGGSCYCMSNILLLNTVNSLVLFCDLLSVY